MDKTWIIQEQTITDDEKQELEKALESYSGFLQTKAISYKNNPSLRKEYEREWKICNFVILKLKFKLSDESEMD